MSKTKYPNIGEIYNAFDWGSPHECRLMKIKIVSITTIDKIKSKYARHIKKLLIEQREEGDFYIKDSNEVVIGTLTEKYNVNEPGAMFYFLRSPKYGWYGTNISDQTHPVLDIDGSMMETLYKKISRK